MAIREDVTRLLSDLSSGKEGANEALFSILYKELRSLAKQHMNRERVGHTLQTTALVHEAFLQLGVEKEKSWENRAHFLRVAAKAMRHILIHHARDKHTEKRGCKRGREPLDDALSRLEESSMDLIALDAALNRLGEIKPQIAQMVELRFFGGLTEEEIAKVMGISDRTVRRGWRAAKAWLREEMGEL